MVLQDPHLEMNASFWHNENMTVPGEQTAADRSAEGLQSALPAPAGIVQGTAPTVPAAPVRELGGPGGPEPTRFGDWERSGRCIDF